MTGEKEALLWAIIDSPDDDMLRLVFADWLEDHGQPERAEFIRLQCELARLPEGDPRRQELRATERRLLDHQNKEWAGPLSEVAQRWEFRRGFVEELELHWDIGAQKLRWRMDECFAFAPVRHLTFDPLGGDVSWETLEALVGSPHATRLRSLNLGGNRVGDIGAQSIAASPYLTRLETLDLSGWTNWEFTVPSIGDNGAYALTNSPHLSNLTSLLLYYNTLSDGALQALRARFGKGVHP
jgi:uncharacterized protein (TIGR02996 family)